MKKNSNSLFSPLVDTEILTITAEVRETLDTGYAKHQCRLFSAADLWRIQNAWKKRQVRRFYR